MHINISHKLNSFEISINPLILPIKTLYSVKTQILLHLIIQTFYLIKVMIIPTSYFELLFV